MDNGILFQIGEPVETLWFAEGRKATRAEIDAAMDKGLPLLRKVAEKEGGDAIEVLDQYIRRAQKLLPAGVGHDPLDCASARLADMERVHPEQIEAKCAKCGEVVAGFAIRQEAKGHAGSARHRTGLSGLHEACEGLSARTGRGVGTVPVKEKTVNDLAAGADHDRDACDGR